MGIHGLTKLLADNVSPILSKRPVAKMISPAMQAYAWHACTINSLCTSAQYGMQAHKVVEGRIHELSYGNF